MKLTVLMILILGLSGCTSLGVKPWQRDLLAQPVMQLAENPIENGFDDHTYFSKEGASGGGSYAGGGCGCN